MSGTQEADQTSKAGLKELIMLQIGSETAKQRKMKIETCETFTNTPMNKSTNSALALHQYAHLQLNGVTHTYNSWAH